MIPSGLQWWYVLTRAKLAPRVAVHVGVVDLQRRFRSIASILSNAYLVVHSQAQDPAKIKAKRELIDKIEQHQVLWRLGWIHAMQDSQTTRDLKELAREMKPR